MTKIKNNGKKIVYVGKRTLMPRQEITVDDSAALTPVIRILEKHGFLTLTTVANVETIAPVETDTPTVPVTVTADSDATGTKKTYTKKTSTKATAE